MILFAELIEEEKEKMNTAIISFWIWMKNYLFKLNDLKNRMFKNT